LRQRTHASFSSEILSLVAHTWQRERGATSDLTDVCKGWC
jgi:hypothetical protein